MRRRYFAGALLALSALLKAKSDVSEEAARQHFYEPEAENGSRWTGFRTSILLRHELVPQVEWLRFDDEPGIDPALVLFGRGMRHLIAAQSGDDQQREIEESRSGSVPAIF